MQTEAKKQRGAKPESKGFLVKFESAGFSRLKWEERIERPITDAKIVQAVRRKKLFVGRLAAKEHSDYGGMVFAGNDPVGSYFIVPGSEQ